MATSRPTIVVPEGDEDPAAPPPSYQEATGRVSHTHRPVDLAQRRPKSANGVDPAVRRSMEDEQRPLPPGWVRQFDADQSHQFFVDTRSDPPRSIWHHPHDDETYLASLTSEERERLQEEEQKETKKRPSKGDDGLLLLDSEGAAGPSSRPQQAGGNYGPTTPISPSEPSTGVTKWGRKMKDRLTGTTHEQREAQRARELEEERQAYARHMAIRQAMIRASQTGQPQKIGHDAQGHDVYIEPPPQRYGDPYGYAPRSYGYSPYTRGGGPYADPNARFVRPPGPYARPYGSGYGGGLGLPIAGGLLGGLLLGAALT